MPNERIILGLMSGSSLDGLDLLLVRFPAQADPQPGHLDFQILAQDTLPYSQEWTEQLKACTELSMTELYTCHQAFGGYLAQLCQQFLNGQPHKVSMIALHGHTVYHAPTKGFSLQLGHAQVMANQIGIPVASEFRAKDIELGGQGAPLAPSVEHWLLGEYALFLNLGGIANLSYHQPKRIMGFDIGAANQLLNALAQTADLPYDHNGALASQGKLIHDLLEEAKKNDFFSQPPPKSLSNQWVQQQIIPLFLNHAGALEDKLHTACVFIAWQLEIALKQLESPTDDLLVSGGGAHNGYLIKKLQERIPNEVVIPEPWIIEQKESLLMALLGYLRLENINNVLCSVTGSQKDHCGGNIYRPL